MQIWTIFQQKREVTRSRVTSLLIRVLSYMISLYFFPLGNEIPSHITYIHNRQNICHEIPLCSIFIVLWSIFPSKYFSSTLWKIDVSSLIYANNVIDDFNFILSGLPNIVNHMFCRTSPQNTNNLIFTIFLQNLFSLFFC